MTDQNTQVEEQDLNGSVLSVDQDTNTELEVENQAPESTEENSVNPPEDENLEDLTPEQLKEKLKAEREEKKRLEADLEKTKHGFEKSISRLTAKSKTLEAELKRTRLTAEKTEPKREDFASDQEYIEASVAHRIEFQAKEAEIQQAQAQANQELLNPFFERAKADGYDAQKLASFGETIAQSLSAQGLAFDQTTGELIRDSEIGHQVLEHLAKYPADALVIAQALPSQKAGLLGRIESALLARKAKPKTTQAPPPVKTQGKATESTSSGGSTLDYIARMKGR